MSIIIEDIAQGGFEIVRERIAEILYMELTAQYGFRYDDWLAVQRVYVGRFLNFNESELPAINVHASRIDLDNHDVLQADGTGIYWIDVYTGAKSRSNSDGAAVAMANLQSLVSVCRGIIQHSEYKTLGFAPPFIMYRRVMQMLFNPPEMKDNYSLAMGRIVLHVKAPETNGLYIPRNIDSYQTSIKLAESERGYYYFGPPE